MQRDRLSLLHAGVGVGMGLPLIQLTPTVPRQGSCQLGAQPGAVSGLGSSPPATSRPLGFLTARQLGSHSSTPRGGEKHAPHPSLSPGTLVDQKSWTDRQTEGSRDVESLPGQVEKVLHPFRVLMGHWSWGKRQDWGEGGGGWQGTAVI